MRRAHADLAGLAGGDFLVVIVENFDLAGGDREAAGQEQLRRFGIVVGLAQHRHRIAFGLAVKLREHRPDPLDAFDQPARRHRGRAIQQQFERGEVGLVERGMIQHHVDHRRHEQREIDLLALDGLEHGFGIKTLQHVHGAAAHQRRQHLCAGDVADRRHRQIARGVRNFEIGQDRGGETAMLAVVAQRALGFAGRAAGVVQRGDIVGPGEAARRGAAGGLDRLQQVDAVIGRPERENGFQARGARREFAAAIAEGDAVDHQHLRFGIFQLKQLIVQRPQRMQPGDRKPRQLRGAAGAPGVGAVGGEKGDAGAGRKAQLHEHALDAADHVGRAAIGDRSARPAERGPLGIARQRPQRLLACRRKRVERIAHSSFSRLFCNWPSPVPMFGQR